MKVSGINVIKPLSQQQFRENNPSKREEEDDNRLNLGKKSEYVDNLAASDESVIKAIERANKTLELKETRFEYSIHEKTKDIMIKVIDKDTDEVIREIPPEKILDMVASMWEIAGLLVDERV